MKQTINFSQFCDAFRDAGREDQYTYQGQRALFDMLTEYEEETGQELELDVIALCCEYQESTVDEVIEDYLIEVELEEDDTDGDYEYKKEKAVREYLSDNTSFTECRSGGEIHFIFASF